MTRRVIKRNRVLGKKIGFNPTKSGELASMCHALCTCNQFSLLMSRNEKNLQRNIYFYSSLKIRSWSNFFYWVQKSNRLWISNGDYQFLILISKIKNLVVASFFFFLLGSNVYFIWCSGVKGIVSKLTIKLCMCQKFDKMKDYN
jgi:hypothetical protein